MCSQEPNWLAYQALLLRALSREWRTWLTERCSMTAFMRARYPDFCVQVVSQVWEKPRRSEASLLSLSPREPVMVRNVNLCAGSDVKIVARSIFPKRVLRGGGCELLSSRPIGEFLFSDPLVQRCEFQFARLNFRHKDFQRVACHTVRNWVWGRRSVFETLTGNLLVTEYFVND